VRKILIALVVALALLVTACSSSKTVVKPQGTPVTGNTTAGAPIVVNPVGKTPIAMIPTDKRTPEQWMEHLGIRLVETRDSSGPAAWNPVDGGLYFMTNESTTWGSTNTKNGVVIFDAKSRKVVGQSNLPGEYSDLFASHSAGMSADGKWIYLPSHKGPGQNFLLILDARTLKINKVYQSLGNPHHVNNLTLPDGREVIAVIDFNWNFTGSGMWIIDPNQDNQIIAGMSREDFEGNPYIMGGENGEFVYVAVPPAQAKYRERGGFLAKVSMKTWKVVDQAPMDDPIWPEVSHDGKWAWVTSGGTSKVFKVDLTTMKTVSEQLTGPGPWGARLNYDESKLYTADKGEGPGLGQQGRTMSVIDVENSIVTNVVPIGLTTDHVILSPDGKELWITSNAEHKIVIYDADKEEKITEIAMPNDGDTHGSTFVQYAKNAKGELVGEVVSSFTGLRGSAHKKQLEFLNGPRPIGVKINGMNKFFGTPGNFAPATITVKPGATFKVTFVNNGGTSNGTVSAVSEALKIDRIDLKPGQRKTVDITAPKEAGKYEFKNPADPNGKPLTLVVDPNAPDPNAAPAASAAPAPAAGAKVVKIESHDKKMSLDKLSVKAGETIHVVYNNGDDEKHNLFVMDAGITSPDVNAGKTGEFDLTMPAKEGKYKVICTYHPSMILDLTVEK
jgi:plastocyanin